MMFPGKKVTVVLSGSGMLYFLHVGALHRLVIEGFEITGIAGVSGGALVAALVASGYRPGPDLTQAVLANLPGPERLLDPSFFPCTWGLIKGKRLLRRMRKLYVPTIGETEIPCKIVTVDIAQRETKVWSTEDTPDADLAKITRASMAIPGVFTPTRIDGVLHVDGGVMANFPLDVFGSGEDTIGLRIKSDDLPGPVTSMRSYGSAVLGAFIAAGTNAHMSDTTYARTCQLGSDVKALDFTVDRDEAERLISQGNRQMCAWLSKERARIDAS